MSATFVNAMDRVEDNLEVEVAQKYFNDVEGSIVRTWWRWLDNFNGS